MNNKQTTPLVSVIVPVYNDEILIVPLIESLLGQDYPKESTELIIVDNNSTDRTKEIVQRFPVILLEENNIQSSYAARNAGLRSAKGEIIAFIDSDCIAEKQWITNGINRMISDSADLVSGQADFIFTEKHTPAEMLDSLTNLGLKQKAQRGVAATCNLFVNARLFSELGMFPDNVKSGGDVQWTQKATKNGFSLIYESTAIVKHPTRNLKELLKKTYRVGGGVLPIWRKNNKSKLHMIHDTITLLKPPKKSAIKHLIKERGSEDMNQKILSIMWVSYLCHLARFAGILTSLISRKK